MGIPEPQLDTWSNPGAQTTSSTTYNSIKTALDKTLGSKVHFESYLQGSYRNDTNIRANSDVDIVVQLTNTFTSNINSLSLNEKSSYHAQFKNATYTVTEFRSDVLNVLRQHFGASSVTLGNKSIKITAAPGRLGADAVVCQTYRRYEKFEGTGSPYVEGIEIRTTRENLSIINYPKLHYINGTSKNAAGHTAGYYKPIVRIFKHMRDYLIDKNMIEAELAPSYFLECFIYNAPDSNFGTNFQNTFCNVANNLKDREFSKLVCQNEQQYLFGNSSVQWSEAAARRTIRALIDLWNGWQ